MRTYKKGDKVRIFEDPWTEQKLEGIATITKVVSDRPDEMHLEVRFEKGEPSYFRRVCKFGVNFQEDKKV